MKHWHKKRLLKLASFLETLHPKKFNFGMFLRFLTIPIWIFALGFSIILALLDTVTHWEDIWSWDNVEDWWEELTTYIKWGRGR